MRRRHTISGLLAPVLFLACTAGPGFLRAQTTPVMPSWLAPFPGASEQTRQTAVMVESTYTAAAAAARGCRPLSQAVRIRDAAIPAHSAWLRVYDSRGY